MPRPSWNQRYQNRASNRSPYVHPKIYGTTQREAPVGIRVELSLRTWAIISGVAALGSLIWLLFFSPAFAIRRIDVVGSVTPDVLTEIQQLQGKNLFISSTEALEARLRTAQSSIRELAVYKGLPDTLRIEVGLRHPVLRWKSGEEEYLIDSTGVPFRRGTGYTETSVDDTAPLVIDTANQPVTIGAPLVRPEFLDAIVMLHKEFPVRFPVAVDRFEQGDSTFETKLITKDGWAVLLDTTRPIEAQLTAFGEVYGKFHDGIKEYVDLRLEGRAYYR